MVRVSNYKKRYYVDGNIFFRYEKKSCLARLCNLNGRKDRIWTCNPLVPNQVLYQVEPLPDMVRSKGFEPPTFWFVAKHSIQLSYERMSRTKFIWILNTNKMVAPAGIEPATQGFSVPCSTDWAMKPNGGLNGTRTRDLLRDRQTC